MISRPEFGAPAQNGEIQAADSQLGSLHPSLCWSFALDRADAVVQVAVQVLVQVYGSGVAGIVIVGTVDSAGTSVFQ